MYLLLDLVRLVTEPQHARTTMSTKHEEEQQLRDNRIARVEALTKLLKERGIEVAYADPDQVAVVNVSPEQQLLQTMHTPGLMDWSSLYPN